MRSIGTISHAQYQVGAGPGRANQWDYLTHPWSSMHMHRELACSVYIPQASYAMHVSPQPNDKWEGEIVSGAESHRDSLR